MAQEYRRRPARREDNRKDDRRQNAEPAEENENQLEGRNAVTEALRSGPGHWHRYPELPENRWLSTLLNLQYSPYPGRNP